jgi:hypothetical protein
VPALFEPDRPEQPAQDGVDIQVLNSSSRVSTWPAAAMRTVFIHANLVFIMSRPIWFLQVAPTGSPGGIRWISRPAATLLPAARITAALLGSMYSSTRPGSDFHAGRCTTP